MQWVRKAFSSVQKWSQCEVVHSLPSNADSRNKWSFIASLSCVFLLASLINHTYKFILPVQSAEQADASPQMEVEIK